MQQDHFKMLIKSHGTRLKGRCKPELLYIFICFYLILDRPLHIGVSLNWTEGNTLRTTTTKIIKLLFQPLPICHRRSCKEPDAIERQILNPEK